MYFSDDCRHLEFRGVDVIEGMSLMDHVIDGATLVEFFLINKIKVREAQVCIL